MHLSQILFPFVEDFYVVGGKTFFKIIGIYGCKTRTKCGSA